MAIQEPKFEGRKAELIAALDESRFQLTRDLRGVSDKMDLPSRVLDSLNSHQWKWVAGSLGAGTLASLLFLPFGRKSKSGSGRGSAAGWTMRTLLKGGLAMAQPALFTLAQDQLRKRFKTRPPSEGG